MPRPRPQPSERDLIQSLRTRLKASGAVQRGIGDDCAILEPPRGHQILVTTDFSLETMHFRRDWHTPESAGHRCLARGLSDLAAMGARPLAAFLSLALPLELVRGRRGRPAWRDRFLAGLLALADRYRAPLAGGDTAQSPFNLLKSKTKTPSSQAPITGWALADIVLLGAIPRNRALLRSGAKAGDRIYVTGYLGGAVAELALLSANPRRFRHCTASALASPNPHPHLFPEPRLDVGAWLVKNRRATAAIDISDSLSTDLDHLCQESHLSATIDAAAIPIHPLAQDATRSAEEPLLRALHGGDDYELLFTAPAHTRLPRRIAGIPITCIGQMRRYHSRAPRVVLTDHFHDRERTRPLPPGGWEHYK